MIVPASMQAWRRRGRGTFRLLVVAFVLLRLLAGSSLVAGSLRAGAMSGVNSSGSNSSAAATSQTSSAATAATYQATTTSVLAQRAQAALAKSTAALQAQLAAQKATVNNMTLPGVPNGLVTGGLVPGVAGTDPANPASAAVSVPVIVNAIGNPSVTLAADTAITLPPTATGNSQITLSAGAVGTLTTGATITPLVAGVAITAPPGSTISLTSGGTISFAAGSTAVPASFSTYAYGAPAGATAPVPQSWYGVGGLSQSTYGTGGANPTSTTVTVTQTKQQALLTWQSFNVGANTTLDFDQSAGGGNVGQWVAINKVAANIAPSQILGSIQAPGQVYVINQNGILFGGSSQINVGDLVASSLPINDNLAGYDDPATGQYVAGRGLLNNPDFQFLFSQLDNLAGTLGPTPAFDPQENDPAPGAHGTNGGVVAHVDSAGNLSFVAASGQDGDVAVEAGARLTSVSSSQNVGGRVALVGPNVNNSGVISTPYGQTILAAGLQVGFQQHDSNDPTLRGLDTFVGAVTDPSLTNPASTAGTATNTGLIGTLNSSGAVAATPGADVILTGAQVNQNGVIDLSTTVSLNSRVDFLADYGAQAFFNESRGFNGTSGFYPTQSGDVSFGAGSLTSLTPDLSSTATVVGTQLPTSLLVNVNQLALSSIVNVQGSSIEMGASSVLLANSANVPLNPSQLALDLTGTALTSGVSLNAGQWDFLGGEQTFYNSTGQVTLGQNATIDVSGSENVAASVADNIVAAQLLSSELENSPLQRGGALEGQTIYVDLQDIGVYDGTAWIGTPLADVSGYINLIQRNVGELTTDGGTVGISAGQSVDLQSGSEINVSGGWINYAGANVQTTKVVSNGQILDISQATPNLVYQGIYNGYTTSSAKWGVSATYSNPLITGPQYEPGYIQGGSGGGLRINAPSMTLAGNLYGNTVAGSQQRHLPSTYNSSASAYANETYLPTILANLSIPVSGSLTLNLVGEEATSSSFLSDSPTPADIVFQPSGDASTANPFAGSGHQEIDLSSDLVNADGFGNLSVTNNDGNIAIPAGVALTASPNGSIVFQAANILIDGNVTAPGGNLGFTVDDYSPYNYTTLLATPASDPTRGVFTLGSGASLSVAGLVVDDLPGAPLAGTLPLATSGGTLSITAYTADLAAGSSLNVSGGAAVSNAGAVSYGAGGSLSILAGRDPTLTSLVGGHLLLGSALEGYSGGKGGSLTLLAPLIQLGGSASTGVAVLDPTNTLLLSPAFFNQGGFATFTLEGLGEVAPNQADATDYLPAVSVVAGTTIDPVVQSWTDSFSSNGILLNATTPLLPSQRSPASLNLDALGVSSLLGTLLVRGDFVLGSGANLETDPKGSISISASTVEVQGDITAPGGTINITGAKNSDALNFSDATDALVTVDLGADSVISAAGTVELTPNAYGYTTGSVLPGGSINISGNLLAESGSVLNVSGAHGLFDVQTTPSVIFSSLRSSPYALTPQASGGGEITLAGGQELFTGATLLGASGGAGAAGGSLTLSSNIFVSASSSAPTAPLDANLVVVQKGATFVDPTPGQDAIGTIVTRSRPLSDVDGNPIDAYFAADPNLFASAASGTGNGGSAGGFAALTLAGTVEFSGSVSIATNRSLVVGSSGVIQMEPSATNSSVTLTAPYVEIGQPFQGPLTLIQQETAVYTNSNGQTVDIQPTYAAGATLTINASTLADVGNLSTQNIGRLDFNATPTAGDIRGDGTLDVAGVIDLNAAQIYPPTETTFTLAAYDIPGQPGSGLIQITAPSGQPLPGLPLSAGATLNVYASNIAQGGVLRAPIGTINLGSGVTSSSPSDALSGQTFDPAQNVTLASGSITSVSAVDPVTGQDLAIPYGTLLNGVSWIDPAGNDITVAGNGANATPDKAIHVSGVNIVDQPGSTVDISGGGDLFAYDFVSGTGGTKDILASTASFAIIPGYAAAYAPDGGYNVTANSANAYNTSGTISDDGYTNSKLSVGEQIYLDASNGLPAGVYTLLPARYALLPGAFLVTPKSGTPIATNFTQPDGSSLVAGHVLNGLDGSSSTSPAQLSSFEVDSQAVIHSRAEYTGFSANAFLKQSAVAQGNALTVPLDAGQLVLAATNAMSIQGTVSSQALDGGIGGQVDIASTSNILISGPNTDLSGDLAALTGSTLVLDSSDLSAFGADSLLIGGYRIATPQGTRVTVLTDDLVVDNAGASTVVNGRTVSGLSGPDVILASNDNLTLAAGADVEQSGSGSAETLLLGNANISGSGDGVLVRVSSDPSARIVRSGVTADTSGPDLTIGAAATIEGAGLTLDSTSATLLDPSANLTGNGVTIDSGRIVLALDNSQLASGLVLSGAALGDLQASAQALSLLSYSSIDFDGSGTIGSAADASGNYAVQSFALHADEILGDGGAVTINAQNVTLDNSAGGILSAAPATPVGGTLAVNAATVQLGGGTGVNALAIGGYATVDLTASQGIVLAATAPSSMNDASGNPVSVKGTATLTTAGSLEIATSLIVGATGSDETVRAAGDLTLASGASAPTGTVTGGLGGSLSLIGQSVAINDDIHLPSGSLSVHATGVGGNVTVGGDIDVSGKSSSFSDLTEYTSGGQVSLAADSGSVILNSGSIVTVAADPGGGNAGSVAISAAGGTFIHNGVLSGQAGTGGQGGSFSADVAAEDVSSSLSNGVTQDNPGNDLTPLETLLDTGGLNQTQSIRVRGGTVNGTTYDDVYLAGHQAGDDARAATYNLSADAGSIVVTGTVDASSVSSLDAAGNSMLIGGAINLAAAQNIVLASGAELNASGNAFSNAGQGGSVSLLSGASRVIAGVDVTDYSGYVDVAGGSTIDLRVGANDNSDGSINAASVAANAALGDFSGTLQIEAPRIGESDVQVQAINGNIIGASSIAVVANQIYNTASYGDGAGGIGGSGSDMATAILNDGDNFLGAAGQVSAGYNAMTGRLFGNLSPDAQAVANVETGIDVVNPTGQITLTSDWDLSAFRFGPNSAAGVLAIQAKGNLVFQGSLSDGFTDATNTATLVQENTALPINNQSWSYNLVAGADFSAADFNRVLPENEAYDPATGLPVSGTAGGSVQVGVFASSINGTVSSTDGQAAEPVSGDYQVIRTGTGNIHIAASGDVLLQNQFATIYTAGVQAPDIANFDTPILSQSNLDTLDPVQYSLAGGSVTLSAQGDIAHVTLNNNTGEIVPDSEKQLPDNWLYRRGYVVQSTDPTDGTGSPGDFGTTANGDIGSTTWWIDFGNFFEGVGALGGGNVSLQAGHDVSNVDAVVPTNTRVPNENAQGSLLASQQTPVELGGGDVAVLAGHDINAGTYYVERGQGTLQAGDSIVTNYTRSPSTGALTQANIITNPDSWLPTTLFLGQGSFDVSAQGDLLLGPVANPFLLPQGLNNTYWDKSYFSTYASTDSISVDSLTGTVTLRTETSSGSGSATPLLQLWFQNVDVKGLTASTGTIANYQPWVETTETSIVPFSTVDALLPAALEATAFSGSIDLVGNLILSPSPTGTISLLADGSLNGLQSDGTANNNLDTTWSNSTLDLSDADPAALPGINDPDAYENTVGTNAAASRTSGGTVNINGVNLPARLSFALINSLFAESGSTEGVQGVLQTKEQLHASIDNAPLHAGDAVPVRLYASDGNVSGITLFSGKAARVVAGQDITDIALYIQNDSSSDISLVTAGRDLLPYDEQAPLLVAAQSDGNILNFHQTALNGDIQISGPGTLEVLAGRNLNLGDGANNLDGTGVGISSIGNERNPVLPFAGADIIAAAGLDASSGLDGSKLDFTDASHTGFTDLFLNPATGGVEASQYLPDLGALMGLPAGSDADAIWAQFNQQTAEQRDVLALDIFYLVLRDAGRDHNNPSGPGAGNYNAGFAAIKALQGGFSSGSWPEQGDISLTSREIKTTNGGNISLLAPGGQLNVGLNVSGVPPIDQGILTEDGGDISIFTNGNVNVGTSRIFTLSGGNEIIWSTNGNIDAGASSKTVQSAPPTRVLVDPQSGAVETDLAGLATGGGIGVLETVAGAPPSDVDLIAPHGTVNAGDAGIRASGNLTIAAVKVLNAGNIQVGGKSSGVPTVTAPNTAGLVAASQAAGSANNAATTTAPMNHSADQNPPSKLPSIITVEVLGYGESSIPVGD